MSFMNVAYALPILLVIGCNNAKAPGEPSKREDYDMSGIYVAEAESDHVQLISLKKVREQTYQIMGRVTRQNTGASRRSPNLNLPLVFDGTANEAQHGYGGAWHNGVLYGNAYVLTDYARSSVGQNALITKSYPAEQIELRSVDRNTILVRHLVVGPTRANESGSSTYAVYSEIEGKLLRAGPSQLAALTQKPSVNPDSSPARTLVIDWSASAAVPTKDLDCILVFGTTCSGLKERGFLP